MNIATAKHLLMAYAKVQDAAKIIRKRQKAIGDTEFHNYRDAFDDFRYFGEMLEQALSDFEYRAEDAQEIINEKLSTPKRPKKSRS